MNKIKKRLSHRSLIPVSPLLMVALVTALTGYISISTICVILVIIWDIINGMLKRV